MNLKTKAIIFTVILGTLPVLIFGSLTYLFVNKNLVRTKIQEQKNYAADLSYRISRFLLERYANTIGISEQAIVNNPTDTATIRQAVKQRVLDRQAKAYGVYDSVAVFDLNGNILLNSSRVPLTNPKNEEYFKTVVKTAQPFISTPQITKTLGQFVIYFAAPVKDENTGRLIGVVHTRVPLGVLEKQLFTDTENTPKEWHLVNNSTGKILAATEKEEVGSNAQSDFSQFETLQEATQIDTVRAIDQNDQEEQLITYAPLPQLPGLAKLNWSVVVAEDTDSVLATPRRVLMLVILGAGIAALLSSVIGILFASRATKIIEKIASAIATSSTEIAATVEQQERIINEQAASVHQTTTTIEQLGASSYQSAEQAESSASGTRQALDLTEEGNQAVEQTLEGISTLKEQVSAIAEQIMRLSEQTGQIGLVSDLVGNLANQTNMLALNASVEAVRAGEQGKGFSVVAGEIRKLADQSKQSAEKINNLVREIQASINSSVMVTDEGTKRASEGIRLAQETAQTFNGLADAVNNVFLNSQQISLTNKQQAVAVQQVVAAMSQLNSAAQESASGINQVKVSTKQLDDAAKHLKAAV